MSNAAEHRRIAGYAVLAAVSLLVMRSMALMGISGAEDYMIYHHGLGRWKGVVYEVRHATRRYISVHGTAPPDIEAAVDSGIFHVSSQPGPWSFGLPRAYRESEWCYVPLRKGGPVCPNDDLFRYDIPPTDSSPALTVHIKANGESWHMVSGKWRPVSWWEVIGKYWLKSRVGVAR